MQHLTFCTRSHACLIDTGTLCCVCGTWGVQSATHRPQLGLGAALGFLRSFPPPVYLLFSPPCLALLLPSFMSPAWLSGSAGHLLSALLAVPATHAAASLQRQAARLFSGLTFSTSALMRASQGLGVQPKQQWPPVQGPALPRGQSASKPAALGTFKLPDTSARALAMYSSAADTDTMPGPRAGTGDCGTFAQRAPTADSVLTA